MGAKLFIGTPWMGNEGVLKKNWFGLCEIAWFLCQPIANLKRGVLPIKLLKSQLLLILDY